MVKKFISLNQIIAMGTKIVPGTICEFTNPIPLRGCPANKNFWDDRNYINFEAIKGQAVKVDGKMFLETKKIRPNGLHEQKIPKILVPLD